MKLIDTHAHLYVDAFENDLKEVVDRAKNNHVTKVLLPNIDEASAPNLLKLVNDYPDYFVPMMGLHPCSVTKNYKSQLTAIKPNFFRQEIKIVGEIGLDYYWSKELIDEQKAAFRTQIAWAKEEKMPIAVHCRDSFDDILDILEEEQNGNLTGVLHCFSGNEEQAKRLIDINFKLGLGGVLTFKNSGLDKVIATIDMKHLVLETDAPYLSPTPYRGKRNESSYLTLIAQKLAEVHGVSIEQVAAVTTKNAVSLFGIQL